MHPILFDFGFAKIYSWGFMMALAVMVAVFGIGRQLKKENYPQDMAFNLVLLLMLAGVIGARIGYVLVYRWNEFLADPLYLFRFSHGGMSGFMWYGGFIAASLTFIVYTRRKQIPLWKLADLVSPFIILGYAIVRVGCFLAGCCYGKVTDSVFGVVFPVVDAHLRYPTQLMSSSINLLFFVLLLVLSRRRHFEGEIFSVTLLGYSLYRFLIEFFRDSEVWYGIFSPGQVISMGLFLCGIILYICLQQRDRRQYQTKHISYIRKPWEQEERDV